MVVVKEEQRSVVTILAGVALTLLAMMFLLLAYKALKAPEQSLHTSAAPALTTYSTANPKLQTEVLIDGLTNPWDVAFLPDETMLVTERSGRVLLRTVTEQYPQNRLLFKVPDVAAKGEGGLMGIEVDRQYAQNNFVYTCYASQHNDVRVVRWKLQQSTLTGRKDIVTGLPLNPSGRHSGCRVRMDATHALWISTGDAALPTTPQDPKSLGGKILRVDRNGVAVKGNLSAPFDSRIYSYGHRNPQGLVLFDTPRNGSAGYNVEHGPGVEDEVNRLVRGNFGWNPGPGYDEAVPMTDMQKYPQAIKAIWASGPTIAPSGATLLSSPKWQAYNGMVALAVLKGQQVRLLQFDKHDKLQKEIELFKNEFGRIRSVRQGPSGLLYLTTDNGSGTDKVIRVTPSEEK